MKTNSFSQIYLHFVIVVQNKECQIQEKEQSEIFPFIGNLVNNLGHTLIAVNGMPEHLHILIRFNPDKSPSETIREIKNATEQFINLKNWYQVHFKWQSGFGVFSYSKSQLGKAIAYIKNQQDFHKKQMLRDAYLETLLKNEMKSGNKFLFDFVDV
jgi:REP element-mobilizing transposase RayT